MLAAAGHPALAQDDAQTASQQLKSQPGIVIGLSFPSVGKVNYDGSTYAQSLVGVNLAVGFSYRSYTGQGLQPEEFNFFWGAGTLAVLLPYWEFGFSYPIPVGNGALLKVDFAVLYIVPYISISVHFSSPQPVITLSDEMVSHPAEVQAYAACKIFVTERLKAPATAQFPEFEDVSWSPVQARDGRYKIQAWVDAQNSFGALLREKFTCFADKLDDGRWKEQLVILGQ